MAVVSFFPLLCLPEKNLKDVLLNMRIIEQFCFSMVSNKTKNFIKEFHTIRSVKFRVMILDSLRYEIFGDKNYLTCTLENGQLRAVESYKRYTVITFPAPQFDVWSLLNYFLYIVNQSKLDLIYLHVKDQFDEEQFKIAKERLKGLEIPTLSIQFPFDMARAVELINTLLPTNELKIQQCFRRTLPPTQLRPLRPILCQTFSLLQFILLRLTLNDLLITNCSKIIYLSDQLSDKDINLFLKHWIRGLIPELEEFWISRSTDNFDIILDGMTKEFIVCEVDNYISIKKIT